MYARVSTFEAPVEALETGIQVWRDEMQPWMREASGFCGWVALLDRANAKAIGISFWATEEAMRPGRWVRTGDYGRLEDGALFISTRMRDLIIRGGENIYPFEIENRIEEHPDVEEVAVLGVDHDVLGQEVKAIVVPRSGARIEVAQLREFRGETLASYKVPAIVEVRPEPLPRNPTGKVMKHVLAGASDDSFVAEGAEG